MKIRNIQTLRIWRYILEWFTFAGIICLIVFFSLTAAILPSPPPLTKKKGGLVTAIGMKINLLMIFFI